MVYNITMQETATREKRERRAVMFTIIATSFVTTFAASSLNIAIPVIGREFQSAATELSWIVTAYFLCMVALSVPFGRLADITGKKRIYVLGVLIFGVMSCVCMLSLSLSMLVAFRALQGVGTAMIFATNTAIIAAVFPPATRGRVLGISVAFIYTGLSVGPVVGGLITHNLGWRYTFALSGVVALLAFAIALAKLPKSLSAPSQPAAGGEGMDSPGQGALKRMDVGGTFLYIAWAVALMYGLTIFTQSIASYMLTVAGIVLLFVFVRFELRAESPIIEIRLFKNINFLLSNLAALFNYGATFAVGYLLSIYLQMVKGYGADISGVILIMQPMVQAVLSPVAGRLSDRHSPYRIASLGMGICTASLVVFVFMDAGTPIYAIIANLAVCGVGVALFSSPNTNAIMSGVQARDYGVASSLTSTMRTMGQVVSMAVITIIMNAVLGKVPIGDAGADGLVQSMRIGFTIFACVCAAGVLISLQRKPPRSV
jgi:EmrB/QacA subfamily drug resistance transporter